MLRCVPALVNPSATGCHAVQIRINDNGGGGSSGRWSMRYTRGPVVYSCWKRESAVISKPTGIDKDEIRSRLSEIALGMGGGGRNRAS